MLKKFVNWFNTYQERRVAYIQLTNLSDKQLRDLGITRSEIVEKIYGREKIQG